MVRTFLKVYMDFGSYFLFLQEQIKDIIIFISFISRKAEELKQNLSPNHMVCGNTRFFKSLTSTLDVAQDCFCWSSTGSA